MRITSSHITHLTKGHIFVFGSNENGNHAGGAAAIAWSHFGAKTGVGFGPTGQSFAIPTLAWDMSQLPLRVVGFYVRRFIKYARQHPNQTFLVTPIGCGIAGFTEEQIAPLFKGARRTKNIHLPKSFWAILNQ